MSVVFDYDDKRQMVIDQMNAKRLEAGKPALTPRQEHLMREFVDDEGVINEDDAPLLHSLLQSNSA